MTQEMTGVDIPLETLAQSEQPFVLPLNGRVQAVITISYTDGRERRFSISALRSNPKAQRVTTLVETADYNVISSRREFALEYPAPEVSRILTTLGPSHPYLYVLGPQEPELVIKQAEGTFVENFGGVPTPFGQFTLYTMQKAEIGISMANSPSPRE